MNLRYIFPAPRTTNFGDYVIHHAIESLLERFLPRPIAWWDIEAENPPAASADCFLLPGITHLTVGERPALERLRELPIPPTAFPAASGKRTRNRAFSSAPASCTGSSPRPST